MFKTLDLSSRVKASSSISPQTVKGWIEKSIQREERSPDSDKSSWSMTQWVMSTSLIIWARRFQRTSNYGACSNFLLTRAIKIKLMKRLCLRGPLQHLEYQIPEKRFQCILYSSPLRKKINDNRGFQRLKVLNYCKNDFSTARFHLDPHKIRRAGSRR